MRSAAFRFASTLSINFLLPSRAMAGWLSSAHSNEGLVDNMRRDGVLHNAAVVRAMKAVDRSDFVPEELREMAHHDRPLPIGYEQTISAPHMHGYALECLAPVLKPDSSVLDVGAGSGYLVAVFAHLCPEGDIYGIEVVPELVALAEANLARVSEQLPDPSRVHISHGDGWRGIPDKRFDAIHVGAAAVSVPDALVKQLNPLGRLILPVGPAGGSQQLVQVDKAADGSLSVKSLMDVRYVPLVSEATTWGM